MVANTETITSGQGPDVINESNVTGLTKENFFNRLQEQYPDAMKHFCKWIDEYKQKVNWDTLFNAGIGYYHRYREDGKLIGQTKRTASPKFHDLPFELQFGIIMQYTLEYIQEHDGDVPFFKKDDVKELFEDLLKENQERMVKS